MTFLIGFPVACPGRISECCSPNLQTGCAGPTTGGGLQQGKEACCLPAICFVSPWPTWCRSAPSNTQLLCLGYP